MSGCESAVLAYEHVSNFVFASHQKLVSVRSEYMMHMEVQKFPAELPYTSIILCSSCMQFPAAAVEELAAKRCHPGHLWGMGCFRR